MTCTEATTIIIEAEFRGVTRPERWMLDAHLGGCVDCRARLEFTKEMVARSRAPDPDDGDPPPGLVERVRETEAAFHAERERRASRTRVTVALAAGAFVLGAALTYLACRWSPVRLLGAAATLSRDADAPSPRQSPPDLWPTSCA